MNLLHHSAASSGGRRVFLAIPSYGPLATLTSFSLFASQQAMADVCEIELGLLSGHCHVDDARNLLVKHFLDSGCDELMFIDADMGWHPEDISKFLKHDRDVVAVTYRKKSDEADFPCSLIPGEIWADADGLIEVNRVPTGFLKIKRHVLETLWNESRQYKPSVDDTDPVAEIFNRDVINGARISGDYNFCRKWRNHGKIFLNPEINLEHTGLKKWDGSYGSHLRREAGLDLIPWINKIKDGSYQRTDLIAL